VVRPLPRQGKAVSLLEAHIALSALVELRAGGREQAAKLLSELATGSAAGFSSLASGNAPRPTTKGGMFDGLDGDLDVS
jgi:hypothetical protein